MFDNMEQQSQSGPIPRAIGGEPSLLTSAIEYREAGRYREAAAWLNEWITTHPHDADALALLGHVLLLDEKTDEALNLIHRAQAIAPKLPSVQRGLARILLKKRRVEEALAAAQARLSERTRRPGKLVGAGRGAQCEAARQ